MGEMPPASHSQPPAVEPDPGAILGALAEPVFAVDGANRFAYLNQAAEHFFQSGASALTRRPLDEILPGDSPIMSLIAQVRAGRQSITEYGITLETPRIGRHQVAVSAASLMDPPNGVVLSLQERSIARQIDRQLIHRNAARSVTAMAAMLAHELKNPLSGIRGAAQLLEGNASDTDRELTRLICDETDRIVGLVDRMEMFTDELPIAREALNIHEALEHVRRLAQSGFGRHLRFVERYDPSLPPVLGNRDLLVQALLNLVKNAAEAAPETEGEILLSSRYRHGVRLSVPGSRERVELPIQIEVQDNGPGIPEALRGHLFDPFVSGRPNGKGLGLALVAKIVGDHGGVIECDGQSRRTVFRILLPTVPA